MYRKILKLLFILCGSITLSAQTVSDIDGNVYPIVKIGKQVWLGENLKVTKFNDGKPISLVMEHNVWKTLVTPAYCWLNNVERNKEEYGLLYNWYAVNTRKLCPSGWHVPSKDDWLVLELFLGDQNTAGSKLKEAGVVHWKNAFVESTNESGFTALPGGWRRPLEDFQDTEGIYAAWWSSTEITKYLSWNRGVFLNSDLLYGSNDDKKIGFSVRCVKD